MHVVCADANKLLGDGFTVGQMDQRTRLGSWKQQRELQVVAGQLATAASESEAWWRQEDGRPRRQRHGRQVAG